MDTSCTKAPYTCAASDIELSTQSGALAEECRYKLRPCTIGACLQLVVVSINGKMYEEMQHGSVSVRIGEVTITTASIRELGSVGRAIAWTSRIVT